MVDEGNKKIRLVLKMNAASELHNVNDSEPRLKQRSEIFHEAVDSAADKGNVDSTTMDSSASLSSESNSKTNRTLVNAVKDFMDNMSISSSSTISNTHDYGDDFISYSDGRRRPSFFIDSSRVSMSSDDEDGPSPYPPHLLDFTLADQAFGNEAIYNDWDSGLSHSSIELHRNTGDDNDNRNGSWVHTSNFFPPYDALERNLDFPHRPLRVMECEICLDKEYLRRRVCCDFKMCNKCIVMYITGKVMDGKVQIECANDRCNALMYKEEIRHRLPLEVREKFIRFLIDANKDPHVKTCPSCSVPYEIDPAKLNVSKKKLKHGVQVTCSQCRLVWCFRCQAPFHSNITCKKYRNEDDMVKRWAKEKSSGQVNAQKCPKCKIFVQKMDGCDHMKCTQCNTDFCYRCGDRYMSVKFFGSHWNRYSLFGCKYRLMPQKNGLRRLIRGSHFMGRVLAAVVLAGLGVAAGAVLVAGSVVILPGYGIFVLRRRMWAAKQRKKFDRVKMRMISMAEKQQAMMLEKQIGNLETVVEESETETLEHTPDPQQIQVIVHHPEELSAAESNNRDCDIIVNRYVSVSEDPDLAVLQANSKDHDGATASAADLKEVSSEEKHKRVVMNIVSSMNQECEEKIEDNVDSGIICGVGNEDEDDLEQDENENGFSEPGIENDKKSHTHKQKGEQTKVVQSELKPLRCLSGNGNENIAVVLGNDVQRNQSLSNGENNLGEKIAVKKVLTIADNDHKNTIPLKTDGENGGKGCFGNIFNVGKRATVNNVLHGEDCVNSNKDKLPSTQMRKAATWEKRQRGRVEMDPPGMNKSSTVDSDNFGGNTLPLIVHRSSSSISSIIGYTNSNEADKKKDVRGNLRSEDILIQPQVLCDRDLVSSDEHCDDIGSRKVREEDVESDGGESDDGEKGSVKKIHSRASSQEFRLDHISECSLVTHL